jgi:hypothetical protein
VVVEVEAVIPELGVPLVVHPSWSLPHHRQLWVDGRDRSDPAQSVALFSEALACAQRTGDHTLTHLLENNAAVFALETGDIPSAREHLKRATRAGEAIGALDETVTTNQGWALREQGDPGNSRVKFEQTMQRCRHNGNRLGIAYAVLGLACVAVDDCDWLRAAALFGTADGLFDGVGHTCEELEADYRRAGIEKVREHLGDERFGRAYAEGRELSFEQISALASVGAG